MMATEGQPLRCKRIVTRGMMLYAPVFVLVGILVAIALAGVMGGNLNLLVMLIVTGIIELLSGYQLLQNFRDVNAELRTTEGRITKRWSRSNLLFFFPSFYIAVRGSIFPVSGKQYGRLLEGDRVRLAHLPHTGTVETLARFDEPRQKFLMVASDGAES